MKKIRLYGFNNLTKTLSFSIYDVCYTQNEQEKLDYVTYIDEQYNSERLTQILCDVTNMIGANVLNISKQDYEPQGASVAILISEEALPEHVVDQSCNRGVYFTAAPTLVGHLDKSHVTVHTYPEMHPGRKVTTFRADIEVSTCGEISPLNALNYLIGCFDSDVITIDYRIRGFTRDLEGKKHYIDHDIESIQTYIDPQTLQNYDVTDMNLPEARLFHTKMKVSDIEVDKYLFRRDDTLTEEQNSRIRERLYNEMLEIYYDLN